MEEMSVIRDQIAFFGVNSVSLKNERKIEAICTLHRQIVRLSGFVLINKSINCLNVVSQLKSDAQIMITLNFWRNDEILFNRKIFNNNDI